MLYLVTEIHFFLAVSLLNKIMIVCCTVRIRFLWTMVFDNNLNLFVITLSVKCGSEFK